MVGAPARSEPHEIKKLGRSQLAITWSDDHTSTYAARYLRQHCQCALCVDEWSGQPRLDPDSVPSDLAIVSVELVGRYALHFSWSDGHDTGIYPFTRLRELCPCPQCSASVKA